MDETGYDFSPFVDDLETRRRRRNMVNNRTKSLDEREGRSIFFFFSHTKILVCAHTFSPPPFVRLPMDGWIADDRVRDVSSSSSSFVRRRYLRGYNGIGRLLKPDSLRNVCDMFRSASSFDSAASAQRTKRPFFFTGALLRLLLLIRC